jgi:hypothetical protein
MVRGIVPPGVSVVVLVPWARAVWHGPRTSQCRGEVVRGGDFSGEAETSCARRRLLVRGRDFLGESLL